MTSRRVSIVVRAAMLGSIAARTQRIRFLSGVLSIWSRTPAVLAMGAATLHEVSGGRAILGLGASTAALTEGCTHWPNSPCSANRRRCVVALSPGRHPPTCSWPSCRPECPGRTSKRRCEQSPIKQPKSYHRRSAHTPTAMSRAMMPCSRTD
jgi:hypothetical protein